MLHMSRRYAMIVAVCLATARPVCAQRLSSQFAFRGDHTHFLKTAAQRNVLAPLSSHSTPDHRWEGFAIGAAVLGVGGAIAGSQLCHLSDSVSQHCARTAIGLGLLGAFLGGITGGLIGGSIPKVSPDSTH